MLDVSGLCLSGGGALIKWIGISGFTLVWTHSVQHTKWEEDWRMDGTRLQLIAARVESHGAGMEPPEGAHFLHGVWHWIPAIGPLDNLHLRRSDAVADWQICIDASCKFLSEFLPQQVDPVTLSSCP
jgi:hypothetical protein